MTQLEGCIQFWQSKLDHERYLMDVATQTMVEATIKYLKGFKLWKEETHDYR